MYSTVLKPRRMHESPAQLRTMSSQHLHPPHHQSIMPRHPLARRLVVTLALGAVVVLVAPVPSSTDAATIPSATPTPWRYPDGDCRGRTKAECTRNTALAALFGTLSGLVRGRCLSHRRAAKTSTQLLFLLAFAVQYVASRRPPRVPQNGDEDGVELRDTQSEAADEDTKSFVSVAPSYHPGTSAPPYTASVAPPYAESSDSLSANDQEAERSEVSLPTGEGREA